MSFLKITNATDKLNKKSHFYNKTVAFFHLGVEFELKVKESVVVKSGRYSGSLAKLHINECISIEIVPTFENPIIEEVIVLEDSSEAVYDLEEKIEKKRKKEKNDEV